MIILIFLAGCLLVLGGCTAKDGTVILPPWTTDDYEWPAEIKDKYGKYEVEHLQITRKYWALMQSNPFFQKNGTCVYASYSLKKIMVDNGDDVIVLIRPANYHEKGHMVVYNKTLDKVYDANSGLTNANDQINFYGAMSRDELDYHGEWITQEEQDKRFKAGEYVEINKWWKE